MNKMHKQNKTSHATLQRKEILEFAATKVKRSNVLSTISRHRMVNIYSSLILFVNVCLYSCLSSCMQNMNIKIHEGRVEW